MTFPDINGRIAVTQGGIPINDNIRAAIADEQRYLTVLYQRLDDFWAETKDSMARALRETDGTPQGLSERDVATAKYADRLAALGAAEYGLCFGRLDFDPASRSAAESLELYIGRMGVYSKDYESLLIDWRAPAARPFYLATAVAPDGVQRRRHIRSSRRRVTGIDDESLVLTGTSAADAVSARAGLTGESALLAALDANRTGRMNDIVETIQAEQDRIIRANLNGALVVQGGPGTGKTAVALHRAAYLLYTHRERLANSGVLVVGPNTTFLRYIGQVLPSLGETAVSLSTIGNLFPGVRAELIEAGPVAGLKGQLLMAGVVQTAVRNRQRVPAGYIEVPFERDSLRLLKDDALTARKRARSSRQPHNKARATFFAEMINFLAQQYAARMGANVVGGPNLLDESDLGEIRTELRGDSQILAALDELWPRLTPQQLLSDLYASDAALAAAAPKLSAAERTLLRRTGITAWSPADVPLLDEAAELLGVDDSAAKARAQRQRDDEVDYAQGVLDIIEGSRSADFEDDGEEEMLVASDLIGADLLAGRQDAEIQTTTVERAAADREWTYGHLIVDEAQELSPMAWRMLMRRNPTRSMTVVGDVAQTSDPAGTTSWAQALEPYLGDRWHLENLTVNYRTPAEIMDVANQVLAAIDPQLIAPQSVRETGSAPWKLRVEAGFLAESLVRQATAMAAGGKKGTLAILVGHEQISGLAAAVESLHPGFAPASTNADPDLEKPIVMLTTLQAKGLEFDNVIVVEPAAIVRESDRGINDLYVAITRPTQQLGVIHTEDLPTMLDGLVDYA
nr:AAA family ATPase [Nakamurella antarctica]